MLVRLTPRVVAVARVISWSAGSRTPLWMTLLRVSSKQRGLLPPQQTLRVTTYVLCLLAFRDVAKDEHGPGRRGFPVRSAPGHRRRETNVRWSR